MPFESAGCHKARKPRAEARGRRRKSSCPHLDSGYRSSVIACEVVSFRSAAVYQPAEIVASARDADLAPVDLDRVNRVSEVAGKSVAGVVLPVHRPREHGLVEPPAAFHVRLNRERLPVSAVRPDSVHLLTVVASVAVFRAVALRHRTEPPVRDGVHFVDDAASRRVSAVRGLAAERRRPVAGACVAQDAVPRVVVQASQVGLAARLVSGLPAGDVAVLVDGRLRECLGQSDCC